MQCRVDLKNDPYRFILAGASPAERETLEDLGHNGLIELEITSKGNNNHIRALSDLKEWMHNNWGKEAWSPDSLRDIVLRLLPEAEYWSKCPAGFRKHHLN